MRIYRANTRRNRLRELFASRCLARHPEDVAPDNVVFLRSIRFWYRYGPAPAEPWRAGYPLSIGTSGGVRPVRVVPDDVRSPECPKSRLLRAPRADSLVQIFLQAEATDPTALGPSHNWLGAFFDAWAALRAAKQRDEAAQEAINKA